MERIRMIEQAEQRVLLVDCSDCNADEIAKLTDELRKSLAQEPQKSVLLLADFSRSQLTREVMERIKVAAVFNRPYLKRSAWVLTGNLPKPAHSTVEKFSTREIPIFSTRDEALAYLIKAA
jgi:hypothetical protein